MRKTKVNTEISKLRILLAAEEEFCQRGFVAANIDSIAKAAGLTKGAIFWHFKSKADLFKEIIKRATGRMKDIFQEGFSSSQPIPIMEKCREVIKRVKKDKAFLVLLVLADTEKNKNMPADVLHECQKEITKIFEDSIQTFSEAKKRGELRADTDIRNVVVAITLIMIGFAKITDFGNMITPISGHIDDEYIIDAMFDGLLSFQKNGK
jgi:TetR/AcrR family transcriptional regulator, repressor of the mexAB-oprM multidrug resistance operon